MEWSIRKMKSKYQMILSLFLGEETTLSHIYFPNHHIQRTTTLLPSPTNSIITTKPRHSYTQKTKQQTSEYDVQDTMQAWAWWRVWVRVRKCHLHAHLQCLGCWVLWARIERMMREKSYSLKNCPAERKATNFHKTKWPMGELIINDQWGTK